MTYKKGEYIIRNDFRKRVVEVYGDLVFVSPSTGVGADWESRIEGFYTHYELTKAGWVVDKQL